MLLALIGNDLELFFFYFECNWRSDGTGELLQLIISCIMLVHTFVCFYFVYLLVLIFVLV